MVYRHGNARTVTIWLDEDLLYAAVQVAERLGYKSFSGFVRDLLAEAVEAASMIREREKPRAIRARIKTFITGAILRGLRHNY